VNGCTLSWARRIGDPNVLPFIHVISGAQTAYISAFYRYYLTLHRGLDNKWAL
jgi:hypothetical protein